jgi:hypothetical protein
MESVLRLSIKPSDDCYGILFHRKLPPLRMICANELGNTDKWCNGIIVNGQKITTGDLWGLYDENPILGYVSKENAISYNGWWQSNNIGARSRGNTSTDIPSGKQRIIIFGESFANCSRVPQEQTWPFFLIDKYRNIEFLNFGVDGYSMGQCLLRYKIIKDKIDYDVAMLIFSPKDDLWRGINVWRRLVGWNSDLIMPRFLLEGGQLKLIASPYKTLHEQKEKNGNQLSNILKDHLQAYDRFYFKIVFDSPCLIGKTVLYKLFVINLASFQRSYLFRNVMKSNSEAMIVSLRICEKMNEEARDDGKKFVLVFLPSIFEIEAYKDKTSFRKEWEEMVSSIADNGIIYIDLMKELIKVERDQLDSGFDGSHYGPKANKLISELLWKNLKDVRI